MEFYSKNKDVYFSEKRKMDSARLCGSLKNEYFRKRQIKNR